MSLNITGNWNLESGLWATESTASGFKLRKIGSGLPVAEQLSDGDIGILMQACRLDTDHGFLVPPEFKYCPNTGKLLAPLTAPKPAQAWVPPFGSSALSGNATTASTGLRRTMRPLALANSSARRADGQSDSKLDTPPPGDYEFFSAPAGTVAAALFCLDPRKGMLRAWLPHSRQWAELHALASLLGDTDLRGAAWRSELLFGFHSRLILPTRQGLAFVTPSVPSLSYQLTCIGAAPAIAAPIWFDGKAWCPLRAGSDSIKVVNLDSAGDEGTPVMLHGAGSPGTASSPVAYGRRAIWPFQHGQLCLQKQTDGTVSAAWLRWPEGIAPQFQFGSPYFSNDGEFWQLCFDSRTKGYCYIKLGSIDHEINPVQAPRFCSGSINFRFARRMKQAPWVEPESGDDASSNFIIPLVESSAGSVLGLRIASNLGLADVVDSEQRLPAVLVLEDHMGQVAFNTIAASQPWRTRLFIHDDTLWAYHPALDRSIEGWTLQQ